MSVLIRRVFLAAFASACLATSAGAAPAAWVTDKAASKLGFHATFGGMGVDGAFRHWDARIVFDPKALAASKAVVTVDLGSATTGNQEQDEALPTGDWFDVAHFPHATFTTRAFKDLGGGRYQAIGDLSLHGVSRPVILPFTLTITGNQARAAGAVTVNRSVFGVGQGEFKSADTVPFNVTINVALSARKAP